MVQTHNLELIICERAYIEAFLQSRATLAAMLQVAIPDSWPTFPEAFSLPTDAPSDSNTNRSEWHGYLFIHREKNTLVGNGGFHGEPDAMGIIEIGYEIASEFWNQGYATEAVLSMIDYAFTHEAVSAVIAHTLAEKNASNRVLQKAGMKFIDEIVDSEEGNVWRWKITRDEYTSL